MLTVKAIEAAKPKEKPYKLADAGGLYLEIMPNDSRYWRMKYRFAGKEKRLAFGVYPTVTLAEARERRDQAKKHLANSTDPGELKKIAKREAIIAGANTFEAIAREWFEKHRKTWAKSHSEKIIRRMERDVFPWLGMEIREI